ALRYARNLDIALVGLTDEWAVRELQICVKNLDSLPVFARELVETLVADGDAAG
ncbi:hypothetical protein AZ17_3171, partial [Bordetella bronchiseptica D989]